MRNRRSLAVLVAVLLALGALARPAHSQVTVPHTFTDGTTVYADEINANFQALVTAINAVTTVPQNTVAFFVLAACPTGWTEYTAARGLYIVGLPSGGTLEGKPASQTALTDKENRATGQHTHTVTDPGHVHAYQQAGGSSGSKFIAEDIDFSNGTTNTASSTTGVTVNNAGTVAGTNAPYVQLLACRKQ
jgi:hypothetical protein